MKRIVMIIIRLSIGLGSLFAQGNAADKDTGSFTDERDNQTYRWVKIGTQVWMAQNLNYDTGKGSSYYDFDSLQCQTYGRLYEWETALKACPAGWHLPADAEWTVLSDFLEDQVGEKLKEVGSTHWEGPDAVVRGDSGFNALPAGYFGRDMYDRPFHAALRQFAYFWSASTGTPSVKGRSRFLYFLDDELHPYEEWKVFGFSVRCLRVSFPKIRNDNK